MEKAKFVKVPLGFVKSIEVDKLSTPRAEEPNPIKLGIPAAPPAIVVAVIGVPEENGRIAALPAMPVGPVAPVAPVAPVGPIAPVMPVAPVGPVAPVAPFAQQG